MEKIRTTVTLLLFSFVLSLSGKEYHVSPKGDDANDGSPSRPFKTHHAGC
jgi:hypothetical protein